MRSAARERLERWFLELWEDDGCGVPPVREYRGIPGRRFSFDFAWPRARVAVEVQGGSWTGGRHTRGSGYERDCEKLNLAQAEGWVMLYLTTSMLRDDHRRWFGVIGELIEARA